MCWGLFSLIWNLFVSSDMVFPHQHNPFGRTKCINRDDPG
jgi:hypothetical protein